MRPCREAATTSQRVGSLLEWRAGMVPHLFHTTWGSDEALPGGNVCRRGGRGSLKLWFLDLSRLIWPMFLTCEHFWKIPFPRVPKRSSPRLIDKTLQDVMPPTLTSPGGQGTASGQEFGLWNMAEAMDFSLNHLPVIGTCEMYLIYLTLGFFTFEMCIIAPFVTCCLVVIGQPNGEIIVHLACKKCLRSVSIIFNSGITFIV